MIASTRGTEQNKMTNEAKKIIDWALTEQNNYGGHIDALAYAINSGRVQGEALEQIKAKRTEWVAQ
jgi:hypothetical protein